MKRKKTGERNRMKNGRIKGIVQAASDLGVSRQHLRIVILDNDPNRKSKSLMSRYQDWQKQHQQ